MIIRLVGVYDDPVRASMAVDLLLDRGVRPSAITVSAPASGATAAVLVDTGDRLRAIFAAGAVGLAVAGVVVGACCAPFIIFAADLPAPGIVLNVAAAATLIGGAAIGAAIGALFPRGAGAEAVRVTVAADGAARRIVRAVLRETGARITLVRGD